MRKDDWLIYQYICKSEDLEWNHLGKIEEKPETLRRALTTEIAKVL